MKTPVTKLLARKGTKTDYSKYLEFMPDFKQEKARKLTTISLTLTSSIILGIFAINPTLSTIANLQRQLQDDKYVEKKLKEKIDNLATLEQKYADIKPDLDTIYSSVPKSPQTVLLVGQLQSLAKDANLTLKNFQISEVGITNDVLVKNKSSYFSFIFTAEGKYQDIISFINNLSNAQRIITINETSITKGSASDGSVLGVSVKGNAYFKQ
jgi:Tfp pilus assembly protein PilO